jgi:hypothetical protein
MRTRAPGRRPVIRVATESVIAPSAGVNRIRTDEAVGPNVNDDANSDNKRTVLILIQQPLQPLLTEVWDFERDRRQASVIAFTPQ